MPKDLEAVKQHAKDLRKESPRPAEEQLGGFPGAARCVDKCRATLLGWHGEYAYACPMDQKFLTAAGLGANEFKTFVATGASDDQIAGFLQNRKPIPSANA